MNPWLYALLCVLGPAAWGLLMYRAFGWVQTRRSRVRGGLQDIPPTDYCI
jgi:hypothetical protein